MTTKNTKTTTDTAATTTAAAAPATTAADNTPMLYRIKAKRLLVGKFWRPAGARITLTKAQGSALGDKVEMLGIAPTPQAKNS
ncbi:MAG: hypothetical protein R3Y56_02320 [Akkermansia sp.]